MSDQEYAVYDFRKASPGDDNALAFAHWISKSCVALSARWVKLSTTSISFTPSDLMTRPYGELINTVPITNIVFTNTIGEKEIKSFWHLTAEDAFLLLAELLDLPEDMETPDRDPTMIELACIAKFIDQLAAAAGESWPGEIVLDCARKETTSNPKRMRMFSQRELTSSVTLSCKVPRGEFSVNWILPKKELGDLLKTIVVSNVPEVTHSPEDAVRGMPVEVIAELGSAEWKMSQLASLAIGDIVVLDQRIDEPVKAKINGKTFYQCWPGKAGIRQALEIVKTH